MRRRRFATMFEKLQHASRLNDNGSFPYLRSHPLTTERIADMQARAQLQRRRRRCRAADAGARHDRGARAVLSNPGVDALRAAVKRRDAVRLAA